MRIWKWTVMETDILKQIEYQHDSQLETLNLKMGRLRIVSNLPTINLAKLNRQIMWFEARFNSRPKVLTLGKNEHDLLLEIKLNAERELTDTFQGIKIEVDRHIVGWYFK